MIELDETLFESEVRGEKDKLCVVDFWAPWCNPCLSQAPIFEGFAKGDPSIKAFKVNVDSCGDLASEFGVMSIPTIAVFKAGKLVKKAVGVQSEQALKNLVASVDA